MAYKFNPFTGNLDLDQVANYAALNLLGTVANPGALPGGATTGDVYQTEDTGFFYVWDGAAWDSIGTLAGPTGPTGATGATGADGADGQTVLNGTVDPTDNVTGTDGDFYINTTSNEIFGPRTAGAWGSGTSLVGPGGGATTLGGLTDVDLTTSPPTNGEALVYDSVNSEWVPGSAGATAAGSANQIQYNDGAGGLAASADLTWDNTAKELGVGGDLNLDDGGTFSTTVQSVTPTANRTISFPDATGTVALVSGSNGTIQYNDAGTLKGNSDFTVDLDWNNASTVFTGLKLNVTDGAGGSPVGNSDSNLIDVQTGGTSVLRARTNGSILFLAGGYLYPSNSIVARYINTDWQINRLALPATGLSDTFLERDDANILAQRNGTASQTFRLYNTWGNNGVDFERLNIRWTGTNSLRIETEAGGTGTARALDLISGSSLLGLGAGAGVRWYVTNNSQFAAASDACTINFGATSDTGFARDSAGVVAITDGSTGTGYVKQTPVLVSALPTAATVGAGTRGFVSDATATTFASVVTGSGTASTAGTVPVYSDGTDWRIG